jgi:hypothetical protein
MGSNYYRALTIFNKVRPHTAQCNTDCLLPRPAPNNSQHSPLSQGDYPGASQTQDDYKVSCLALWQQPCGDACSCAACIAQHEQPAAPTESAAAVAAAAAAAAATQDMSAHAPFAADEAGNSIGSALAISSGAVHGRMPAIRQASIITACLPTTCRDRPMLGARSAQARLSPRSSASATRQTSSRLTPRRARCPPS